MPYTDLLRRTCPVCGYEFTMHTVLTAEGGERALGPGDLSVCINCSSPLKWEADPAEPQRAVPHKLEQTEMQKLPAYALTTLMRTVTAVRLMNRKQRGK